ncbi:MAG: VOC family protein [candidate division Zixibacteria bacterium]|nr:VOC family protein [candidate division Zixibacteria bacterium]
MIKKISQVIVMVENYDKAINWYSEKLGFELHRDIPFGEGQRWVSMLLPDDKGVELALVRVDSQKKLDSVGNQTADNVFLVVETDDCKGDYEKLKAKGVVFHSQPEQMTRGIEVIFEDLYGNRINLLQAVE